MTKKLTQFERIKEFVLLGYTNEEIAEILNISNKSKYIQRVRRVVSKYQDNATAVLLTLTPKRYYNVIQNHNGTKEELAAKLGVSRMTLHNFEKATKVNQKLAEYLYLQGFPISRIARILGTKESTLKKMGLEELPTLSGIKGQIKRALDILDNVAELDENIAIKRYSLNKVFDKLK